MLKEEVNLKNKDYKILLSYILPAIAGLIFNSLYIVVDGILVSRMLGRNALAAVTVAVPALEILLALSMLFSVGSGVIISRNKGEGKEKEARTTFNLGFRILGIFAIFNLIFSLIFRNQLAMILGSTEDINNLVVDYLTYFFIFSPTFMYSYALCAWLRNDSKPKLAMIAQIVGALSNVFLDYLFMGPLKMGISGAALATGLGPIISILIMLPHFVKKNGLLYLEKVKYKLSEIKDIILKGIPAFTMEFSLGLTTLCVNLAISVHLGSLGFAAYGIVGYIALIVLSLFLGMAEGIQPLISYYNGSKQFKKIKYILKTSLWISIIIGLSTYIFLYFFNYLPISVFVEEDLELINLAKTATILYFPALFISGINIILTAYLQAIEKWKQSIVISLARSMVVLLPLLILMPNLFSKNSLFLAVPFSELLTLPIGYVLIKFKK